MQHFRNFLLLTALFLATIVPSSAANNAANVLLFGRQVVVPSAQGKVAILGDSQPNRFNRFNTSGRALDNNSVHLVEQSNARLGQRFKQFVWEDGTVWGGSNQGVGGWKLSDIQAFLPTFIPQAVATGIDTVFMWAGDNGDQTLTAATRITQYADILAQLKAAGFPHIVLGYLSPRDVVSDPAQGWVIGDPRWQWRIDINAWLDTQECTSCAPTVHIWRTNPAMYLSPATGQPQQVAPYLLADDAHNAPPGSYLEGNYQLDDIFNAIYPVSGTTGTWLPAPSSSLNYWANYALTGTAGVASTGVTGTVATSMTIERVSGDATCVASKNGSDQQIIVCTPGTVTSEFYLRPTSQTTYLAAAMNLPASAYLSSGFKWSSDSWNGWAQSYTILYDSASGTGHRTMSATDNSFGGFNQSYTFTSMTPPVNRGTWNSLRVRFGFVVYATDPVTLAPITGTGQITVMNAWHIQVENPISAFNLIRAVQ